MASSTKQHGFSHLQDVLGSLQMVKRYINLTLCFSLRTTTTVPEVEKALTEALEQMVDVFPFLAGQVIYEGRDDSHSGLPKIIPLESHIQLLSNDLTQSPTSPSLSELHEANYPFSLLDGAILVPSIALTWDQDSFGKIAPVLLLQVNFVKGGLLLTFSANHTTFDMTGLGHLMTLFAKACRNEPFTTLEIDAVNADRTNAISLLPSSYHPGPELDDIIAKPHPLTLKSTPLLPPHVWAYFNIPSDSLAALKALSPNHPLLTPYISTDDLICALFWLTLTYTGHLVDCISTSLPTHRLLTLPLPVVASHLRLPLLSPADITLHARRFATYLSRLDDKSTLINGANLNLESDVVMASYANVKCLEQSYGSLLGRAECARQPRLAAAPSGFVCMPKDEKGGMAVGVRVTPKELEGMKGDEELRKFAVFVG